MFSISHFTALIPSHCKQSGEKGLTSSYTRDHFPERTVIFLQGNLLKFRLQWFPKLSSNFFKQIHNDAREIPLEDLTIISDRNIIFLEGQGSDFRVDRKLWSKFKICFRCRFHKTTRLSSNRILLFQGEGGGMMIFTFNFIPFKIQNLN